MLRQHRRNDLMPQRAEPRSTHTHTLNDDFFRDLRSIQDCGIRSVWIRSGIPAAQRRAAVELKFAPTQLFGEPHGEGEVEREMGSAQERRAPGSWVCVLSSSHWGLFI
jgi:hypothetical protein